MRRLTKRAGRAAASLSRDVVSVFGRVKAGRDSWKRVAAQRWRLPHVRDGIVVPVGLRRDPATLVTFLAAAKNPVGLAAATSRCNGRRSGRGTRQPERRKGKIVGQKAPFKLEDNWALRVRLQMEDRVRQSALLH